MPLLCLALTGRTIAENRAALERYRGLADIAELRADLLNPEEMFHVRDFPASAGIPCILTVRRRVDGGGFSDGEGVRLVLIAKALAYARSDRRANFAYVDLEDDFHVPAVEEACRIFGTRIIRSCHCIDGFPENVGEIWKSVSENPEEIPKLAVMPRGAGELAQFFTWAEGLGGGDRVLIGMGDFGVPSRILAARLGSTIAYASPLAAGMPVAAPGHLDPRTMLDVFRFRQIGSDTSVYGLAGGRMVAHSSSPVLHNGAFGAAGIDSVYLPMPAETIDEFMACADALHIRGAAVTVPLKEDILRHLDFRSPEVEDIGACNTIVRRREGGWAGYNTDAQGFERSLLEFLGRQDLHGLRATIVGAGGASKAVAYVLARLGVAGLVLNRTPSHAKEIARRYGFAWSGCDERAADLIADHADLIVQASSVGMEGGSQGDPLEWYDFEGREAVCDLIYRPEQTALLKRAAAAGCRCMNGWSMLRYQAAAQFAIWTGQKPPELYFK
ncbi:MAG TPA: type I 3-dehydroquinate dehydratase [Rectinemataceae bacterium]|nr:type I 3-dehydroquinate dehydratase [Rectinemataceae bacterium]